MYRAQAVFAPDSLQHYGVMGMKWGVRKDRQALGKRVANGNKNDKREKLKKALKIAGGAAVTAAVGYAAYKAFSKSSSGKSNKSDLDRFLEGDDDTSYESYNSKKSSKSNLPDDITGYKPRIAKPVLLDDELETIRKNSDMLMDMIMQEQAMRKQAEAKSQLQTMKSNKQDKFYDPATETRAKTYNYNSSKMESSPVYKRVANVAKGIEKSINEDTHKKGSSYTSSQEYKQRTQLLDSYYETLKKMEAQ